MAPFNLNSGIDDAGWPEIRVEMNGVKVTIQIEGDHLTPEQAESIRGDLATDVWRGELESHLYEILRISKKIEEECTR